MAAEIVHVTTDEQLQMGLDIRKKVFVEEQKVPVEEELDEYDVVGDNAHHMLLVDEGIPVATGRLIYYKAGAAKMQRIAVHKAYRSKGYGRVLLLALEELAREIGLEASILDAQCHAEEFYKKLGYKVISQEPFYDAGILHVRMEKAL
ncbi:GCN5 family acetyltransferase [Paenibacillus helianthi]|uniref:GCN5 family acetyltransferase n=1 Tax=Paenibacillus helianthi TaxID=1349432 RepID=A0ABX3EV74_9BACL|nr:MULTISPECIES: GNAT family N-acetyltransferase [Paenibacillus]OKP80085.1 GCN5 family acetyltransferase [Paenibacillus sp. P3E]OKP82695.1 GCN5 family acetyltransferase [Paenibacillus sp. P32E]OKP92116.1 GCN5 family acetyltransferase [Paenibacillus helianthi]